MCKQWRLFALGLALFWTLFTTTASVFAASTSGGTISGVVTDKQGTALAGIQVFAEPVDFSKPTYSTKTNSNGIYTLTGLPNDTYTIMFIDEIQPPRYMTTYYKDTWIRNDATILSIKKGEKLSGIDEALFATSKIRGHVTDPAGNPISNTEVTLFAYADWQKDWGYVTYGETDENGNYLIEGLFAGIYRVRFRQAPPAQYPVMYYPHAPTVDTAGDVIVQPEVTVSQIDGQFELATGSIAGVVTADHGQPLQNVWVELFEDIDGDGHWKYMEIAGNVFTGIDGLYNAIHLRDGAYRIGFLPANSTRFGCAQRYYYDIFYPNVSTVEQATSVSVQQGQTTTINVELPATGRIRGRITNVHGAPLQTDVTAYSTNGNFAGCFYGLSDEQGNYEIGLPGGDYYVSFTGVCYHCPPNFHREYYDDGSTSAKLTILTVVDDQAMTGINGFLSTDGSPIAHPDRILMAQTVLTNTLIPTRNLVDNDYNPDSDQLTATVITQPAHGALTLNANGLFTYTLTTAPFISDTFTYRASNDVHESNVTTVTMSPVNAQLFLPFVGHQ